MQKLATQAVILAAGQGVRMRALTDSKPLLTLLGMPLLERLIRTLHSCGVDDIIIVTGHQHQAIEAWLETFRTQLPGRQPQFTIAYNAAWERSENGASLLAAAPYVQDRFLLLMADHVYDRSLIQALRHAPLPIAGAVLATDGEITRCDIDKDDVTRVQLQQDSIIGIGKHLSDYQGFDTGAFLCSFAVIKAMQQAMEHGKTRLSDAMQILADRYALFAHRVDGHYWQDVDTPEALTLTERALLKQAAGKTADGPVARWCNRPFSRRITQALIHTRITPNQISLIAFTLGILAALVLIHPTWTSLIVGGLLVQIASVVDGCDGELARLRLQQTHYGGWLDALLDRYADGAILAALTWHAVQVHHNPMIWWLGLAAIGGSFISSYSAHKADHMITTEHSIRIGRDSRSLLIFIGALINQPLAILWIIAIVMNLVVIRRIISLRHTDWSVPYHAYVLHPREDPEDTIDAAMRMIRDRLAQSPVPEDPGHAENTLQWLLKLAPNAGPAMRLAALAHDIERARPERLQRNQFDDYDAFKAAHASVGAHLTDALLRHANVPESIRHDVYHLIRHHETGGDRDSDLLKDADSLSYFEHNLPLYYAREGATATLARARWGYQRLSFNARQHYESIQHRDAALNQLLQEAKSIAA